MYGLREVLASISVINLRINTSPLCVHFRLTGRRHRVAAAQIGSLYEAAP